MMNKSLKEHHSFKIKKYIFDSIINVFTVTFDQFNVCIKNYIYTFLIRL